MTTQHSYESSPDSNITLQKSNSNVSYPSTGLDKKLSKRSSFTAQSQSLSNPTYLNKSLSKRSFNNRNAGEGNERVQEVIVIISQENDNIYRLCKTKITGFIFTVVIVSMIYGISWVDAACSPQYEKFNLCSSSINSLIFYDVIALVYLGINITINILNAQKLDDVCICFLLFRKNAKQQCWQFFIGLLFGLIIFIVIMVTLVLFLTFFMNYCENDEDEDEINQEGNNDFNQGQSNKIKHGGVNVENIGSNENLQ